MLVVMVTMMAMMITLVVASQFGGKTQISFYPFSTAQWPWPCDVDVHPIHLEEYNHCLQRVLEFSHKNIQSSPIWQLIVAGNWQHWAEVHPVDWCSSSLCHPAPDVTQGLHCIAAVWVTGVVKSGNTRRDWPDQPLSHTQTHTPHTNITQKCTNTVYTHPWHCIPHRQKLQEM